MKRSLAAVLMPVAAFCVYGFIASGEPGLGNIYICIGHVIVGLPVGVSVLELMAK